MAELRLDASELRPVVQEVVAAVLQEFEGRRALLNGKLAIPENEAAQLLGLNVWQLRDIRLSGKIGHTRIVGNRIRYTTEHLTDYLEKNDQPGT